MSTATRLHAALLVIIAVSCWGCASALAEKPAAPRTDGATAANKQTPAPDPPAVARWRGGHMPTEWFGLSPQQVESTACAGGLRAVEETVVPGFPMWLCTGFDGPAEFGRANLVLTVERGKIVAMTLISNLDANRAKELYSALETKFDSECQSDSGLPEMFARRFGNCRTGIGYVEIKESWKFPSVVLSVTYADSLETVARMNKSVAAKNTEGF